MDKRSKKFWLSTFALAVTDLKATVDDGDAVSDDEEEKSAAAETLASIVG
jgi:hypothetical protein